MAIDLKFKQDSNGDWDIDFANGDFELTDGLDTAVYMSVFCEKRASSSQVSEPNLRRGHFTNEFSKKEGYQVGSFFWLYTEQAKNIDSNLRLIEGAIGDGLAWMIEDNIFSKTKVVYLFAPDFKSFSNHFSRIELYSSCRVTTPSSLSSL